MKFSSFLSGLHSSTKATIVGCAILLVIVTTVMFFLVMFPFKMDERTSTIKAEPAMTYTTATTMVITTKASTTTATTVPPPLRTLSTWEVQAETLMTETDENGVPWYDKIFTTATTETDTYGNLVTNTAPETIAVFTERPYIPQTKTETVKITEQEQEYD